MLNFFFGAYNIKIATTKKKNYVLNGSEMKSEDDDRNTGVDGWLATLYNMIKKKIQRV